MLFCALLATATHMRAPPVWYLIKLSLCESTPTIQLCCFHGITGMQ